MGELQKFGSDAGSGAPKTIIAPTAVTAGTGEALITDFGVQQRAAAADGIISLELSNDNFNADIREVSRVELPTGGTILKSFDSPIKVLVGEEFRVQFSQGTPGTIGVELMGQTKGNDDIRD